MADDEDDLTQDDSGSDDSHAERWRREFDAMTPEERARITASINASFAPVGASLKANIDSMLDQQCDVVQSMNESLGVALRAATAGFSTESLLAGVDWSGFGRLAEQINSWSLDQLGIQEYFGGLRARLLRGFPANLLELPDGVMAKVGDIVRDEGIALYGAPRREIVIELVEARDSESRRGILGVRAADISADCRSLLETCSSEWSRSMAPFGLSVLDSFDAGHTASAQALAASIIDTLLYVVFGSDRSQYTPGMTKGAMPRTTDALESLPFRQYYGLAPIWHTYQRFRVEKGDPIPATFNRHASAHAVSDEQYTLVNAVQSILYSSTLLWFIDQEIGLADATASGPPSTDDTD